MLILLSIISAVSAALSFKCASTFSITALRATLTAKRPSTAPAAIISSPKISTSLLRIEKRFPFIIFYTPFNLLVVEMSKQLRIATVCLTLVLSLLNKIL